MCAASANWMPDRVEIIPAILPKHFDDLVEHLSLVKGLVKTVQIDICDGIFVPSKTFPFVDRAHFESILAQEEGLPMWDEFEFEVDLMVAGAAQVAGEWVRAGASRIIVHTKSRDAKVALEQLQPLRDDHGVGIDAAIAIGIDEPLEALAPFAPLTSTIQCMGIAKIGVQGEALDERIFARAEACASLYPEHVIAVDGGVTIEHAKKLVEAGVRRLAVGSHLFDGNVRENLQGFKAALS